MEVGHVQSCMTPFEKQGFKCMLMLKPVRRHYVRDQQQVLSDTLSMISAHPVNQAACDVSYGTCYASQASLQTQIAVFVCQ